MQNNYFDDIQNDVPVYFISGFLDSGKTSFIQETLEDRQFDTGGNLLLIVCEEGETEYDLSKVRRTKVTMKVLEDEERLTPTLLSEWQHRLQPDRVMVEYNGMWMKDSFYRAMPVNWMIQQEFFFAESASFLSYNANMRNLVYDKLRNCDVAVFNRYDSQEDVMPYHKIVRQANRACAIIYEDTKGALRYDEIVDPLPFDKEAPVIQIEDRDFAIWYQDLTEELRSYDGKTVRFKGQVSLPEGLGKGVMAVGRHMMNCCAADIAYVGLIAEDRPEELQNGDWVEVTGRVKVKRHAGYQGATGPVLTVEKTELAQPPEELVATFY